MFTDKVATFDFRLPDFGCRNTSRFGRRYPFVYHLLRSFGKRKVGEDRDDRPHGMLPIILGFGLMAGLEAAGKK